jgi:hypothetical protein
MYIAGKLSFNPLPNPLVGSAKSGNLASGVLTSSSRGTSPEFKETAARHL